MCGLFGFVGQQPDMSLLVSLLQLARRRGPDTVGIAWVHQRQVQCQRWLTPPSGGTTVMLPRQTTALIGQARLATSGQRGLGDAQPLLLDPQHAFAHNGTVYAHETLQRHKRLACQTACDSEVLGQLWREQGDARAAMAYLAHHQGETPHAWLGLDPWGVWLVAWGQPLHILTRNEGHYCCTQSFPGAQCLASGTILHWET